MHTKGRLSATVRGAAVGAALLLIAPFAHADENDVEVDPSRGPASGIRLSLRVEPGVAVALTAPQADQTTTGFGQTVKVMLGVRRYLAIGPAATFTTLPGSGAAMPSMSSW